MESTPGKTSGYSGEGGTGSLVTEQVKQGTQQVAQQTQQTAGQVVEGARNQAMSYADTQKQQAAQSLHGVAQALRQTGENLRAQNQDPVGRYADVAAERVENFTTYVEKTPVQQMVQDVEYVARRHSTLFLGGAALLGFAAARFLKASSRNVGNGQYGGESNRSRYSGYDRGSAAGQRAYGTYAPYADVAMQGTPSPIGSEVGSAGGSTAAYSDATVFDPDGAEIFESETGTERIDGPSR
ncbi:MAG TPA: hypothetical protein VF221_12410 [Chloroflexota bacterium]